MNTDEINETELFDVVNNISGEVAYTGKYTDCVDVRHDMMNPNHYTIKYNQNTK